MFRSEKEKNAFQKMTAENRLFKVNEIHLSEGDIFVWIDLEEDDMNGMKSDLEELKSWEIDDAWKGEESVFRLKNTQPNQNYQIRLNDPAFKGASEMKGDSRGAREGIISIDYNDQNFRWDINNPLEAFKCNPNIKIRSPHMFCLFASDNPPPNNRIWCKTEMPTLNLIESERKESKRFEKKLEKDLFLMGAPPKRMKSKEEELAEFRELERAMKPKKEKRKTFMGFWVTDSEKDTIEKNAEIQGKSVSAFLRDRGARAELTNNEALFFVMDYMGKKFDVIEEMCAFSATGVGTSEQPIIRIRKDSKGTPTIKIETSGIVNVDDFAYNWDENKFDDAYLEELSKTIKVAKPKLEGYYKEDWDSLEEETKDKIIRGANEIREHKLRANFQEKRKVAGQVMNELKKVLEARKGGDKLLKCIEESRDNAQESGI